MHLVSFFPRRPEFSFKLYLLRLALSNAAAVYVSIKSNCHYSLIELVINWVLVVIFFLSSRRKAKSSPAFPGASFLWLYSEKEIHIKLEEFYFYLFGRGVSGILLSPIKC